MVRPFVEYIDLTCSGSIMQAVRRFRRGGVTRVLHRDVYDDERSEHPTHGAGDGCA
jgi:hypothetical protein